MVFDVYVPLVASLLLGAASPLVARRMPPAVAVRVLVAAGLLTAASFVWALVLLAGTLYEDIPDVAADAHARHLNVPDPVPEIIGIASIVLAAIAALRVGLVVRARRRARVLTRTVIGANPPDTELIVADSTVPRAFAVPGRPGHVFVTTAMLRGLDAAERDVLLAHERAHLRHRHGWLRMLVNIAAAVDPLLIPLRGDVEFLLERWADEQAARAAGDRGVTARALARAALLSSNAQRQCALAFADQAVLRRVNALHHKPPRPARAWAAIVLACALVVPAITADATGDFVDMFWRILPG